jgi:hypothetical protein
MKNPHVLLPLASCLLLGACSTPPGMTVQQYASLTRPIGKSASKLSLQMTVSEPGTSPKEFPKTRIVEGKPIHLSAQRDFLYPASYQPAIPPTSRQVVTPATPQDFKTVQTGLEADLRSSRQGSVVIVEGTISVTDFQGFSRMGGSFGKPILDGNGRVLTENRVEMPKFATYTTPVFVAIKPGDSATFQISHPRKNTTTTISVVPET